jgi:hypothetical protein
VDCSEVAAWAAVLADPRIEGFQSSVQRYARRPHHADAELLAVSRAHIQLEAGSAADVRGFLGSYPDGPNALNAKPRLAKLPPSKSDGG